MSTTRNHGGTGLGLAICSRLAEAMNGRIWVESELGKGSKFTCTIRVGVSALIVDDNPSSRLILESILGSWNIAATLAESAEAAVDILQVTVRPFDLLITDTDMPRMDGFD